MYFYFNNISYPHVLILFAMLGQCQLSFI